MAEFSSHQLTDTGWRVLTCAREEAVRLHAGAVDTDHILAALATLDNEPVKRAFAALGVGSAEIVRHLEALAKPHVGEVPRPLPFSAKASQALELATAAARMMDADRVDAEHLLLGVLKENTGRAAQVMEAAGVGVSPARDRVLDALRVPSEARAELGAPKPQESDATESLRRSIVEAREEARRGAAAPLAFPARELTASRDPFDAIGRTRELKKMEEVLLRGDRASLFLIGPQGCGRRSLVRAFAAELARQAGDGFPRQHVYLFEPQIAREAAPPIFMGEGGVVGRWIAEVLARAEASIFAFSGFVSDEWVYDDFVEFIIPAVLRRWVVGVFLVTLEERRELARRHPGLTNVTLEMELGPIDAGAVREIVAKQARAWPKVERLSLAETAAEAAVNLASKFVTSSALPGSAIDILERTRSRVLQEHAPHLPDIEQSIDGLQRGIKEAAERGAFERAASLRRERDAVLAEYDSRLEKLLAERGTLVVGTGEIVKTVAQMSGKSEEDVRAAGVWR